VQTGTKKKRRGKRGKPFSNPFGDERQRGGRECGGVFVKMTHKKGSYPIKNQMEERDWARKVSTELARLNKVRVLGAEVGGEKKIRDG